MKLLVVNCKLPFNQEYTKEEITVHFSKKVRTLELLLLADLERCSSGHWVSGGMV